MVSNFLSILKSMMGRRLAGGPFGFPGLGIGRRRP